MNNVEEFDRHSETLDRHSEIREIYQEAVEILVDEGHNASLYENYSGRAMHGEQVPGITVDSDCSAIKVGWAISVAIIRHTSSDIAKSESEDLLMFSYGEFYPKRWDQLGLGMIFY